MTNGRSALGVYVGDELVNISKFVAGCKSGTIIEIPNGDGTYTYKFADK